MGKNTGKSKITVLHLIASLETAGAEKMLVALVKNAQDKNIRHVICTIYPKGQLIEEAKAAKIELCTLGIKSKLQFLLAFFRFVVLCSKIKPDIIESYMLQENLIARIIGKLFLGKKVICGKRDSDRHKAWHKVLLDKITMGLCDLHISNSLAGEKELFSYGLHKEKAMCIPNGKDFSEFSVSISREEAKKRLGFNESDFVLGCVARLYKYKGQDYLLRAMPSILSENSAAKLVLAGDGVERKKLQALAKELGIENKVIFLGERKDIPLVLRAFDIFVFPSLREGMPGALMEAMASGLPVVATDIDGNVELIRNGEDGIIVPSENSKEIKNAVIKLMHDEGHAKQLGKSARKKILENYAVEKMVKSFEGAYWKLWKGN